MLRRFLRRGRSLGVTVPTDDHLPNLVSGAVEFVEPHLRLSQSSPNAPLCIEMACSILAVSKDEWPDRIDDLNAVGGATKCRPFTALA
jgi:hypothetical protein